MKTKDLTLEEALPLFKQGKKIMVKVCNNDRDYWKSSVLIENKNGYHSYSVDDGKYMRPVPSDGYYIESDPVEEAIDEIAGYNFANGNELFKKMAGKVRVAYLAEKAKWETKCK